MKPYRRRSYFIDRAYQGRIVISVLSICAAGMLLELGMLNYLSYGHMEKLRWTLHPDVETVGEIVRSDILYTFAASALLTSAALYAFLRSTIIKTAGPIYRLKKDLDSASNGDLSIDIWVRRDDDFKETASELNDMMKEVRKEFSAVAAVLPDIVRAADVLEFAVERPEMAAKWCAEIIHCVETARAGQKPPAGSA